MQKLIPSRKVALWLLACTCFTLLSVKWMFPPAAWLAPGLLALLMLEYRPWKSLLVGLSVLYVSTLLAGYKVMPFPLVVFLLISLLGAIAHVLPFFIFRVLFQKIPGWYNSLLFPCLYVVYDYLNGFGGGGTWGSIAYSQVGNGYLMQLASVTGLWGITFLVAWSSILLMMWFHLGFSEVKRPVVVFASLMVVVLLMGMAKTNPLWQKRQDTVRVAGITGQNLELLLVMYEAAFGNRPDIDVNALTQTSPELAELNKGLVKFIENPTDPVFASSHLQMEAFADDMLLLAAKEAMAGAKIISFSEALLFTTKATEHKIIEKAKALTAEHEVYLLLTLATIIPGKVAMGAKYLENKALLIGPDGKVLNTFFKNKPVPLVEPSVPGDGLIPVIDTPYGRIAISICYDADFPYLMRQAGHADMVLLPSGDWKEISPYHALMATVRGIENGISLLRPVSNAASIAADYHGKVLATADFKPAGQTVVVSQLPVKGIRTFYGLAGDWLPWVCGIAVVLMVAVGVWKPTGATTPETS